MVKGAWPLSRDFLFVKLYIFHTFNFTIFGMDEVTLGNGADIFYDKSQPVVEKFV